MSDAGRSSSWPELIATALLVFVIAAAGSLIAFGLWLQDLSTPQVAILGAGDRLSLLVIDGPARLLLSTGNDPISYENALSRVRPIFARRVDVLLVAGTGESLLVPLAASNDPHLRTEFALAQLSPSAESAAFGVIPAFPSAQRIRLGPSISVIVETALPFGAEEEAFPAWRATVEHGQSRVVVLSDGDAAALFPPANPASVVIVSGDNPAGASELSPAPVLVANAETISGPDLRQALAGSRRPPQWTFRVFPGEALRLRFVPGGVELPSESAQRVVGTPGSAPTPLPLSPGSTGEGGTESGGAG